MTPAARLTILEFAPLTAAERATLLQQFEQLSLALEAVDVAVSSTVEPATGFDPLLGDDA